MGLVALNCKENNHGCAPIASAQLAGEAVTLDVVASHMWPSMTRTVPGSIRIPPEEVGKRYPELPRDTTIITYCT